MPPLPWSTNQLKKLGIRIRDGETVPDSLPGYNEVMFYFNDVAAETQARIAALDWSSLLEDRVPEVTSRPKTIDTLRQKLQRDRATPLPSVQDIAGVRFEAEMTLDEQDAVAHAIAGAFEHDREGCERDLRNNAHSGYRAVHLWLRLPARVEVQIRTHLQGQWANTYEAAADVLGREIRYGELPGDRAGRRLVESLQEVSTVEIRDLEEGRNRIRRMTQRLRESDLSTPVELETIEAQMDSMEAVVQQMLGEIKDRFDKMRVKRKG